VGGFVFPGDRVDLMLTQTIKEGEGPPLKATETVLSNIRVLATDQSTQTETVNGKTVVRAFRTVTLEVTPRIAEKVQVAQTIGTLSLSLRSLADNQAELEAAIASGDISVPNGASKEEEEALLAAAMARPQESGSTYVTGGDVSRFQRSTMPRAKADNNGGGGNDNGGGNAAPTRVTVSGVGPRPGAGGGNGGGGGGGPAVRITRGKSTTVVNVGKNGVAEMMQTQRDGIEDAGQMVPSATSGMVR
jgi:pilus assembly protein CpaB